MLAALARQVELDGQPEDVAVEGHGGVEVLGLDDEAELADTGVLDRSPGRGWPPPQLGRECVEPLLPEPAERREPGVDLGQRGGVDGVEAVPAVGATVAKPLSRSTLSCMDTAGCPIPNSFEITSTTSPDDRSPLGQQLEDPAPDRVAEDVEGVHHSPSSGGSAV